MVCRPSAGWHRLRDPRGRKQRHHSLAVRACPGLFPSHSSWACQSMTGGFRVMVIFRYRIVIDSGPGGGSALPDLDPIRDFVCILSCLYSPCAATYIVLVYATSAPHNITILAATCRSSTIVQQHCIDTNGGTPSRPPRPSLATFNHDRLSETPKTERLGYIDTIASNSLGARKRSW